MKRNEYPLLLRSVWFENSSVAVLDETALPAAVHVDHIDTFDSLCTVLQQMKVRGLGQTLLIVESLYLVSFQQRKESGEMILRALREAGHRLKELRKTFQINELVDMVLMWAEAAVRNNKDVHDALHAGKDAFLRSLYRGIQRIVDHFDGLIEKNSVILTHCNVGGVLGLIARNCACREKAVKFFVTETRPFFQGAKLTAYEIMQEGMPITIIPDNAAFAIMPEVDMVIVGADRVAANGDIVNKIGTYQIALAADNYQKPFYAFARNAICFRTGREIPIEVRGPRELLEYRGKKITTDRVDAYYPAFDVTPAEFITKIIFAEGVFAPSEVRQFYSERN